MSRKTSLHSHLLTIDLRPRPKKPPLPGKPALAVATKQPPLPPPTSTSALPPKLPTSVFLASGHRGQFRLAGLYTSPVASGVNTPVPTRTPSSSTSPLSPIPHKHATRASSAATIATPHLSTLRPRSRPPSARTSVDRLLFHLFTRHNGLQHIYVLPRLPLGHNNVDANVAWTKQ